MKRTGKLSRHTPLARTGRIRPRSPERRASAFARTYGSKARVAWVKSLPCFAGPVAVVRCEGPVENAHTETGGTSYKADAATIAPLCRAHHTRYDRHQPPFHTEAAREAVKAHATQPCACIHAIRSAVP